MSCSKEQVQYFVPGNKDLSKSIIMVFSHGYGSKINLVMRKMDNIGYIKSYGGVKIYLENLRWLKNKLEFSHSLVTIALLEQRDDHPEKDDIDIDMWALLPAAKDILVVKRDDVSKLIN